MVFCYEKLNEVSVLGLESRLRYTLSDREKTLKQMEQSKGEIEKLEHTLKNFAPSTTEIEKIMRERDHLIQGVKERMNRVEDTVFAEFCSQIGIRNIRQYEEGELRSGYFLGKTNRLPMLSY